MEQLAYNVYLGRKLIDTVFFSGQRDNESVRKSLINHDGYDSAIRVVTPRRKMKNEYAVQGDYGQGWEDEAPEDTRREALVRLREYKANMPKYAHRIHVRRVPVEE